MIKVIGNKLWRSGSKIGWISAGHVFDASGNKVGFYTSEHIFDTGGRKLAAVEGDHIYYTDSSKKINIEDNNRDISGGSLSNIEKAAVRVLLGE